MRVGKTGLVVALLSAALGAYSYQVWHRLIAERIAVIRGVNTMPPDIITEHRLRLVHEFADILFNLKVAIDPLYPLKRDFYTPDRLARFLAVDPGNATSFQNGRDFQIRSALTEGLVDIPASIAGPRIVQFVAR